MTKYCLRFILTRTVHVEYLCKEMKTIIVREMGFKKHVGKRE